MRRLDLGFKFDPKLNPVTGKYYGVVSFELEGSQQVAVRNPEFNTEKEALDFVESQFDDDDSPLQDGIRAAISVVTGHSRVMHAPEIRL